MKFLGILFFSFGILLILFGISIFTPFLSWVGKRLNSSNFSSYNYKQPESIRATSMFMGICLFIFGLFITIASAALINVWNTPDNHNSSLIKSVPQSVTPTPETFPSPMMPGNNPSTPPINSENNSFVPKYRLDCPPDKDGLNIRREANLNAQIITVIPCNAIGIKDRKERYYQDGVEWYLVKYQQNTGWVAGKYLKQQATNPNKTTVFTKLVAKKRP